MCRVCLTGVNSAGSHRPHGLGGVHQVGRALLQSCELPVQGLLSPQGLLVGSKWEKRHTVTPAPSQAASSAEVHEFTPPPAAKTAAVTAMLANSHPVGSFTRRRTHDEHFGKRLCLPKRSHNCLIRVKAEMRNLFGLTLPLPGKTTSKMLEVRSFVFFFLTFKNSANC